jgi:CheY-like chemotaxis protein
MARANGLVAEDEQVVANDLRSTLQRAGYNVVETVSTGEEAIEKATTHRPDLVLMDIDLEGPMDGIEAARRCGTGTSPMCPRRRGSKSNTFVRNGWKASERWQAELRTT